MNTKNKIILGGILIAIVAFYAGTKYAGSTTPIATGGAYSSQTGGIRGGRGAMGGFVSGSILSIDSTGLTIKLNAGGSKIVFVGSSTPIMKSVLGAASDLVVGENVSITGSSNTDGSVNAQSIQIRPAQNLQK